MGRPINLPNRLKLLELLEDGFTLSKIAKLKDLNPSGITRKVKALIKENLVEQIPNSSPHQYKLTLSGRGYLVRNKRYITSLPESSDVKSQSQNTPSVESFLQPTISFHDFKVKLPITKHGQLPNGTRQVALNGWIKQLARLDLPFPLTLELTPSNAILHFSGKDLPRNMDFFTELFKYYTIGTYAAINYLKKYGYGVDVFAAEVINQHIAARAGESVEKQTGAGTFEVPLSRPAASISGTLKQEARAWIDRSEKDKLHIESNDLVYEEKLIRMPEEVWRMKQEIRLIGEGQVALLDGLKEIVGAFKRKPDAPITDAPKEFYG
jgi:DNA-binding MarR family transcriptional regulator